MFATAAHWFHERIAAGRLLARQVRADRMRSKRERNPEVKAVKAFEKTDEASAKLLKDYQAQGCIGIVVRALPDGSVSAIFAHTDPKLLGAILRAAADMISAPAGTSIH